MRLRWKTNKKRTDQPRKHGSIPGRDRKFFLPVMRPDRLWSPHTHTHTHTHSLSLSLSLQWTGGVSPRVERSGRENEHSPSSSAEVDLYLDPATCLYDVHRNNFTFANVNKILLTCMPLCLPPRMLLVTSDSRVCILASCLTFSSSYIRIVLRVLSLLTGICHGCSQSLHEFTGP